MFEFIAILFVVMGAILIVVAPDDEDDFYPDHEI